MTSSEYLGSAKGGAQSALPQERKFRPKRSMKAEVGKSRLRPGRKREIIEPSILDRVNWLLTSTGVQVARQMQVADATGIHESTLSKLLRPRAGEDDLEMIVDGSRYVRRDGLARRISERNAGGSK